jgi:hypothetical protein
MSLIPFAHNVFATPAGALAFALLATRTGAQSVTGAARR